MIDGSLRQRFHRGYRVAPPWPANINAVTGQEPNAGRANTQTLIGALCFLASAVLPLAERSQDTCDQVTARPMTAPHVTACPRLRRSWRRPR